MTHINQRRDSAANWTAANPVLMLGEVGWEYDTRKAKLGDGVTAWNGLQYVVDAGVLSVNGASGDVVLTKADIGLGAVDNTPDLDKPISALTQAAMDAIIVDYEAQIALKADLDSPAFVGVPTGPTPEDADESDTLATTQFVKSVLGVELNPVAVAVTAVAPFTVTAASVLTQVGNRVSLYARIQRASGFSSAFTLAATFPLAYAPVSDLALSATPFWGTSALYQPYILSTGGINIRMSAAVNEPMYINATWSVA